MAHALKPLLLTTVVSLALGMTSSSVASAHEFQFPTGEEITVTSTPDGTGKTAHHLLLFFQIGYLTCGSVSFHGTVSGKEVAELTLEPEYSECLLQAVPATVQMGGCAYLFHADGTFEIVSKAGKSCVTEPMTIFNTSCLVAIGPQEHPGGITYHNIQPGATEEVTLSMNFGEITGKQEGTTCSKSSFSNTEYATGNAILTASKAAKPSEMVNMSWE
jgi:hypothetical protein